MKRFLIILSVTLLAVSGCSWGKPTEARNPDLAAKVDPSCSAVKTKQGKLIYLEGDAKKNFGGSWGPATLDASDCIITISRFRRTKTDSKLKGETVVVTPGDMAVYDRQDGAVKKELT